MTPEQQTALEGVVGRPLTATEIADINVLLPDRQDMQIAKILSADRVKFIETRVDEGKIISTIATIENDITALTIGNLVLDEITTNPLYRHVKNKLFRVGLDISEHTTRNILDLLAQQIPEFLQSHADAIKNLAKIDDPINFNVVSDALNIAEGRLTL